MPHALSPLVAAAAVADLVGTLLAAAILAGLYRAFPRPHLRSWSWSFVAGGVRTAGSITAAMLPPLAAEARLVLSVAIGFAAWLQAAWLIAGARELARGAPAEPRLRRIGVLAPLLLALACAAAAAAWPHPAVRATALAVLPLAATAGAALVCARRLARGFVAGEAGLRLLAGAIGLYGLARAHDAILRASMLLGAATPGYPAYLGFANLAVLTALSLGAVMSLLDEERRRLELAEQKFAKVFRSSPDAIALTLPREDGRIVEVNERFSEITGYAREEAVGRTTLELGLFHDVREREALAATASAGRVRAREIDFGTKGGERRTLSIAAETFELAEQTFAVTIARDATESRRAEQALRESELRFRHLATASFEGVAMSEQGVVLDANEQLAAMLGCGVADLVGRPIGDFVAEASRPLVEANLAHASAEPYQHLARRADGSQLTVEVRARTVPYRGRTVRLSAVRDISERVLADERQRQLEASLRLAAEEWRQTFDALEIGILLAGPDGRVARLNRSALELARARSQSFDSIIGRPIDALPGEPWATLARLREELLASRTSQSAEARDAASGRSYTALASLWLRGEPGEAWSVLTFRDVTGVVAIQGQLRQARVMEAMGSLVAGVAHEVRNPLFGISATVDAMEAGFRAHPEFDEHAALLRSQVRRLTRLMRDLIDYGRPAVLQRQPAPITDVVARAARSCAALAAERQVSVELDLASGLPPAPIDAARLEQACENLIANAIQHAPQQSRVRVSVHLDGRWIALAVEDEGPGLPKGAAARVFEPFFTRRKGGTGLGLSIVQRVVEAHGGEVAAANRDGRGARFSVRLPLAADARPGEGA